MTYNPADQQQAVIDADDSVLLVCGGAGTGKTTTAAAAVRAHLERTDRKRAGTSGSSRWRREPAARALFLSFSRSSVAQILDRAADVLGSYQQRVEITTFHAFAWRLLKRWGNAIGLDEPRMLGNSEAKLFPADGALRFKDMLPNAIRLCAVPAIRRHLRARWSIIVSDEFQDTDERQYELLTAIRGEARLLLLGDPNQCIYSDLPDAVRVGPERLDAALTLPGARRIDLPDVSHRDPSNVLPAAAAAMRRRDFGHNAITTALTSGRLQIRAELPHDREADEVAAVVQQLRNDEHTVGVFSHHIDATTNLSDQLTHRQIDHEIVGLPESLVAALDAQNTMLQFAGGMASWELVQQRLAVFVTSSVRGRSVPDLAQMLLAPHAALSHCLAELREALWERGAADALSVASTAHDRLDLRRGERPWHHATHLLRPLLSRSMRRHSNPQSALESLNITIAQYRTDILTHAFDEATPPVQLMGLYQAKGREADATVVVLRSNDFFGYENEPFEAASRLLYVVLTRARHKTMILLFGSNLPSLIAPLRELPYQADTEEVSGYLLEWNNQQFR